MIKEFATSSYLGDVEMTWGDHVARMLEKLFFDKTFIDEVEKFRIQQKIPVFGFRTVESYDRYIKKHQEQKKVFEKKGNEMARERKLPGVYAYWIEAFLWIDFMCALYIGGLGGRMIPGHGYAIARSTNPKDDYVEFRIYRGASIKGFLRFIKQFSFIVEDSYHHPKGIETFKLPQVRKTNNARNSEIFKLYKEGKVDMDGVWHERDAHSKEDRPKCIRGLSADSIRKIVIEERRKEKIIYRHEKSK